MKSFVLACVAAIAIVETVSYLGRDEPLRVRLGVGPAFAPAY